MKLCLVGGHLTPALALGDIASKRGDLVTFIGRFSPSLSLEQVACQEREWSFFALKAPKVINLRLIPQFLSAYSKAQKMVKQIHPDIVVSFGSFLSVPVGLAAKRLHLKLMIHEQTAVAGLANRLLSPFADQIAVSFPQSLPYFPKSKTMITGNPLRSEFYLPEIKKPAWLRSSNLPIIYITGGSQGSVALNQVVTAIYPKLTSNFQIIHQCGGFGQERGQNLASKHSNPNLYIREWLDASEAAWCMKHSSLIISRAGANTICEIIASQAPSILVPLPQARFQEQYHNAKIIENVGSGLILEQASLNPDSLMNYIDKITDQSNEFKDHGQTLRPLVLEEAAENLYEAARKLCNLSKQK